MEAFDVCSPGKYVLFRHHHHFIGFRTFAHGLCRLQCSHRTHEGRDFPLDVFHLEEYEKVFRLEPSRGARAAPTSLDELGGSDHGQSPLPLDA